MTATHPQVQAYLQRHQLKPERLRTDGRLTLSLGERARMQLQPLPGGALLFEGRVAPLPPAGLPLPRLARLAWASRPDVRAAEFERSDEPVNRLLRRYSRARSHRLQPFEGNRAVRNKASQSSG